MTLCRVITEAGDLRGKRVLVRLDLNVPIVNGEIRDAFRITQSLPTLTYLQEQGAKTVIVAHIEGEGADTLKPVYERLSLQFPIVFKEKIEDVLEYEKTMEDGSFVLMENIRHYEGEKKNDEAFSKQLAEMGDIYVNDGFSVSHRPHASVVGIPAFLPSYVGFLMEKEIKNLSLVFSAPHPFLFILGGAKFSTKMPLVEKFLTIADTIFICGALGHDIFKARGYNVGKSLVAKEELDLSTYITNPHIEVPSDVVVETEGVVSVKKPNELGETDSMRDSGPETIEHLKKLISEAKCVLWNGPLGEYERNFSTGTEEVAKAIAETKTLSIVGGGDTLAVVDKLGITDKFTFVSSGGGAMLDFLANGTLPGLKAIEEGKK
jgi:3-phosphoglycerate kinase